MVALFNANARFNAAVPATWFAKLNSSVCQPFTVVTVASVSQLCVGSFLFSTFNLTCMPACGEYTLTFILFSVAVNGMFALKPVCTPPVTAVTVVPANNCAVFVFITFTTVLVAKTGSGTIVDCSAPSKPTTP